MKVLLHDAIFAPGAASEQDVDKLVIRLLDGRHLVHLDAPSPHFDALLSVRGWGDRWRRVTGTATRAGARNPLVHAIEVDVRGAVRQRTMMPVVDVPTAVAILEQPLRVVLENGTNDANFLCALAALDGRLPTIRALLADGDVRFEHGGGLPDMLVSMRRRGRDPLERLRCFVLHDSDALAPGRPSDDAAALSSLCERNHVGVHQLSRRAAENYLPPPRIKEWGESQQNDVTKRRARAWCQLEPAQRHHFAMREGLSKDEDNPTAGYLERRRDLSTGVDLFDGLPEGPRTILRLGFDRALRPLFEPDRPEWDRWLREDGQEAEVRELFRELLSRL